MNLIIAQNFAKKNINKNMRYYFYPRRGALLQKNSPKEDLSGPNA